MSVSKHYVYEGKIVVAEDQMINLEILHEYFVKLGLTHAVTICING